MTDSILGDFFRRRRGYAGLHILFVSRATLSDGTRLGYRPPGTGKQIGDDVGYLHGSRIHDSNPQSLIVTYMLVLCSCCSKAVPLACRLPINASRSLKRLVRCACVSVRRRCRVAVLPSTRLIARVSPSVRAGMAVLTKNDTLSSNDFPILFKLAMVPLKSVFR